jgi:tRNA (guanine-N7-)-methyltransferase
MSDRHHSALDRLVPQYGIDVGAPFDQVAVYGRRAPLVLEIGSGMGEATADMAAADPHRDYLAVEIHTPGVANLLTLAAGRSLTNVRVVEADALSFLREKLSEASLDAIHVFFPDPWPKLRHRKRRLFQAENVALMRSRLVAGGTLVCSTDWSAYAAQMLATMTADPELRNLYDGYAPDAGARPATKFELRAIEAGRTIHNLAFERSGALRTSGDCRGLLRAVTPAEP